MSRGDGRDLRKSAVLYFALYTGLALSQWLGSLGQVGFAAAGMLLAPVPVAVALSTGRRRRLAVLLGATAIAGAVGYRSLGGAAGFLAIGCLGIPIGMGIVQGRSYGRSVALTTGLMFAAVAGVLLGDWRELGPMAADSRRDFVEALDIAEAEPSDNLRSVGVLERQIWMMDNWPYLLFGVGLGMSLIGSCATISMSRNWLRWREGVQCAGSFRSMRPHEGLVWLLILSAGLWFLERSYPSDALRMLSWNAAVGFGAVYWINGVSVVAFALRAWGPNPLLGAVVIFAILLFLSILFFVGLFDTWADFRRRLQHWLDEAAARDNAPDDSD